MIRTFGAIGDIHAEDALLERALSGLEALGCDAILAVGDLVDGRGSVDRCVSLLRAHNVITVRGNHERWFLAGTARGLPDAHFTHEVEGETLEWIERLPPTWTGQTVAGTLLLCHAVGDDDMVRLTPDDDAAALAGNAPLQRVLASGFEIMVCGHTHQPMVRNVFGLVVVNAGTLHRDGHPGYVHVDLASRTARLFAIDGRLRETVQLGTAGSDVWGSGF